MANAEGMLSPYRVLDLTDEKGLLCGKLLGDLGADVIKVERPGGDPARRIGPFYHDEVDPEKSLFWFALNTSKRGITLDIETSDGQETFRQLTKGADFVIESFPPGYMDKLGLGYEELEKVNPRLIMVSITPFGQTGPYKDYMAPDIVAWAMGGVTCLFGDADRNPTYIGHDFQAYFHGAVEAAGGAMIALHHRRNTGEGQHVDVSIVESAARGANTVIAAWQAIKAVRGRGQLLRQHSRVPFMWTCKDGYVLWFYWAGPQAKRGNEPLIAWMESEGVDVRFLKELDWISLNWTKAPQEVIDQIEKPTKDFFKAHTKAELMEGAMKNRVMLYPVSTTRDLLESKQLSARKFWAEISHPELGTKITYPGPFAHSSEESPRVWRRAPLVGEHNNEIYEKELHLVRNVDTRAETGKGYTEKAHGRGENGARKGPLAGLRIVDFTWVFVGPQTTKFLADCGAEVIKIESKNRPDMWRSTPPFKDNIVGFNRNPAFNMFNTSKRSVSLNLAHPKGIEVAKRLIASADIVVENFAGGVMKRMGLGYEELKKVKPDIIMLSSCMQGQTGPHASSPGFAIQLTALAGFDQITGWPDRDPLDLGAYTDYVAPLFNLLVAAAALDYRNRTGKGQHLDLSQFENGIHFMSPLVLDYVVNGRTAGRMGNRSFRSAPHNTYRCRGEDKWCAIAVYTDEQWGSLCRAMGRIDLASDPRFLSLPARKKNEEELDRIVEAWTVNCAPMEVMTKLQSAGVGAGALQTAEDMMEHDPQLEHRRFFRELEHPETGKYRGMAASFLLSKSPYEIKRAPLLGEHNEYALKDILGMSDEETADLIVEGVLE